MCPVPEISEREHNMDVSIFEQDPSTREQKMMAKWAVKQFLRVENKIDVNRVRTPDVILKTVHYLIQRIVDVDNLINCSFKMPLGANGKKRLINFEDVY